ncbi:MAG: DUF2062 domain-containing protein, partial [Opitutaceae bacterium]
FCGVIQGGRLRVVQHVTSPSAAALPPAPSRSWRQRGLALLRAQLTQGVTPDRLALSIAVGAACSLVPFLGFTSLLNAGVGAWFRLNHPVMQILNQLLGPVQLVLIVAYVRLGEKIWAADPMPVSVSVLVKAFREDAWAFLQRFGWTGVHAATAWVLTVPLIVGALYFTVRPALRRLASLRSA